MTHFVDLSVCCYHSGAYASNEWRCPLLAVGWIETGHKFPIGLSPEWLLRKIADMRHSMSTTFISQKFRGLHQCSICPGKDFLQDSHINLFVPGNGCVYLAPGRIDHYIELHKYRPPSEFIDALAICPDPTQSDYFSALRASNNSEMPPLSKNSFQTSVTTR